MCPWQMTGTEFWEWYIVSGGGYLETCSEKGKKSAGKNVRGRWSNSRHTKRNVRGVPAVVQWVKNPTAEAQVWSPFQCCGLNDMQVIWCRSQQQCRFNPWPRNIHMPWAQGRKEGRKKWESFRIARNRMWETENALQVSDPILPMKKLRPSSYQTQDLF